MLKQNAQISSYRFITHRALLALRMFFLLAIILFASRSQAQITELYQPSYKTLPPDFVLSTNEAMVFGGEHGIPNSCGGQGYLLFVPWTGEIVKHESGFAELVDLEEGQFPNSHYQIQSLCQNEQGEVVVVLRPRGYDVIFPNYIDLVLTFSLQGELLNSETVIIENLSVPPSMDSDCVDIPNQVEYENGAYQKDGQYINVSGHTDYIMGAVYIQRYSEGQELPEPFELSVSNVSIENFYCYWLYDAYTTGNYGNVSHMLNTQIEITNYGVSTVCSFELNLDRGTIDNNSCGAHMYKHFVLEECLEPGESTVLSIEEWVIPFSDQCHEELCITVFSPDDQKNVHPESTVCEIFPSNEMDCAGLPCIGSASQEGILDENCECDFNALCHNDLEVSVHIECFEAGYNTYHFTISGGAPEQEENAVYTLNGLFIYNEEVSFGEPFEVSYGADMQVAIQITDNAGCSFSWQTPDEIDCFSGVSKPFEEMYIEAFPNPVQDFLNLNLPVSCGVSIHTTNGELLEFKDDLEGSEQLNLSHYPAGALYVMFESENARSFRKIIKL